MDIETEIKFKGNAEEVLAQLECINEYISRGWEDRDKPSFSSIWLNTKNSFYGSDSGALDYLGLEKDDLIQYVKQAKGKIYLNADGPYGNYAFLSDIDLFKRMAETAPKACFDGQISGNDSYEVQYLRGQLLKNGLLKLTIVDPYDERTVDLYDPNLKCYIDDIEISEDSTLGDYIKSLKASKMDYDRKLEKAVSAVKKCLPYREYLKLTDLRENEYSETDYEEMLYNIDLFGGYNGFLEFGGKLEYSEEQYDRLLEKVMALKYRNTE